MAGHTGGASPAYCLLPCRHDGSILGYYQKRFQDAIFALGISPCGRSVAAKHHLKVTTSVAFCCAQNGSYVSYGPQACPRISPALKRNSEPELVFQDRTDAESSPEKIDTFSGNVAAGSFEMKGSEKSPLLSTADTSSHDSHARVRLGHPPAQDQVAPHDQEQHAVGSAAPAVESQCSGAMLTEHFADLKSCEFIGPWTRMHDTKIEIKENGHQSDHDRDSRQVLEHGLTVDVGFLAKSFDSDCSNSFRLVDKISVGSKGRYQCTLHNLGSTEQVRLYKQLRKGFLLEETSVEKISTVRLPAYRTKFTTRVDESLLYLQSMGVDCGKVLGDGDKATVVAKDIKRLRSLVSALESHGLEWKELGRIFNLCPRILSLCPEKDIKLVTTFLFDEAGLQPKDFGKVIRRCPRLLVCDVAGQLQPTLKFLKVLGFSKMGKVICSNPTLLSLKVDMKLVPKLTYLESLGFSYREATSMVVRFPAIFNYNIEENLEPKYRYLVNEMGGSNKDLLAFPQYFGYSLDKRIIPRHRCIAALDVPLLSVQALLTISGVEFKSQFACRIDKQNGVLNVQD